MREGGKVETEYFQDDEKKIGMVKKRRRYARNGYLLSEEKNEYEIIGVEGGESNRVVLVSNVMREIGYNPTEENTSVVTYEYGDDEYGLLKKKVTTKSLEDESIKKIGRGVTSIRVVM